MGKSLGGVILEEWVGVCQADQKEKKERARGTRSWDQSLGRGAPEAVLCGDGQSTGALEGSRNQWSTKKGLDQRLRRLGFPLRVLGSHGRVLRRGGV